MKMCIRLLFAVPTLLIIGSSPTAFSTVMPGAISSAENALKGKADQGGTAMGRPTTKRTSKPAPTHRLPSASKTSGRDSESEPSDETLSVPADKEDVPIVTMEKPLPTMCQAHLLLMDRSDGLAASPKPCHGKRIKPETLLISDWLYQSGVRAVSENGPVIA